LNKTQSHSRASSLKPKLLTIHKITSRKCANQSQAKLCIATIWVMKSQVLFLKVIKSMSMEINQEINILAIYPLKVFNNWFVFKINKLLKLISKFLKSTLSTTITLISKSSKIIFLKIINSKWLSRQSPSFNKSNNNSNNNSRQWSLNKIKSQFKWLK
jgi:hypothetical protein